jgi:hypothetical protein
MKKYIFSLFFLLLPFLGNAQSLKFHKAHVDKKGIIRWENNEEVGLFGANYCLPSACDYRAAGRIIKDRKALVDQDMTHFARMNWDALRLSFWGDFENTDKNGNLVNNEHLDLMDYVIYKARERGIYMLLSPIVTYSSLWPDAMNDTSMVANSLSGHFRKSELGTNPDAIKAQCNYLIQLLNHVNLYTGIALKDDPAVLFIEMINEPWHHSDDFDGSVKYINALADAVKSTGCKKLLFHNVSQDMKMARAINASKVDGASFAWYPMGLVSGYRLTENHLRAVDDFTPMHTPELAGKPRIVYEFDEADSYSPYMYPAMVRSFRNVGAQFATMFSYDMLATAPFNLGWQTHLFNMVYYPKKAVAGIIAAEMMKTIPLYSNYGKYPDNMHFGPVRISYENDMSEFITKDKFIYANTTNTKPESISTLTKIAGYGSSPLVHYPGKGLYFLDKIKNGLWRLELYPDAMLVSDPFSPMSPDKVVSRLIKREWNMNISLPDLGNEFNVIPVNKGNNFRSKAENGSFSILPGVYLLSVNEKPDNLPAKIGMMKFDEYVCPEPMQMADNVILKQNEEFITGKDINIEIQIISDVKPDDVTLFYHSVKYPHWFKKISMKNSDGYTYSAIIPAGEVSEGVYEYCVCVSKNGKNTTYPSQTPQLPTDWDFYTTNQQTFTIVNPNASLCLLNPLKDYERLAFSRTDDLWKTGAFDILPLSDAGEPVLRIFIPSKVENEVSDYSLSLSVKDKIIARGECIRKAKGVSIRVKGCKDGQTAILRLMESDGTTWCSEILVSKNWKDMYLSFDQFKTGKGILLPQGYPGDWNYWIDPAKARGGASDTLNINKIESLQFSFGLSPQNQSHLWMDMSSIELVF